MKTRTILFGIFGVITIVGGYLVINYFYTKGKGKDNSKETDAEKAKKILEELGYTVTNSTEGEQITANGATYTNTGTAISYGSYGDAVGVLQAGLIEAYTRAKTLPKFGADKQWGKETQAALNKYGWATTYANLDAIEAEIKKHKQNSAVANAINNAETTVYNTIPTNLLKIGYYAKAIKAKVVVNNYKVKSGISPVEFANAINTAAILDMIEPGTVYKFTEYKGEALGQVKYYDKTRAKYILLLGNGKYGYVNMEDAI